MIIEAIFTLVRGLLTIVFNLLPNLPSVPDSISSVVDEYISLVCDNSTFFSFFLDVEFTKNVIVILLSLFAFRKMYKFIMWVYRKLPISSD